MQRPSRPSWSRGSVAAAVVASVLLTGACQSSDAFGGNRPDDQPEGPQLVVRTPETVPTDLPYSDPPLVVPLPGPTGGTPGEVPTTAAPFSPGPEGATAETDDQ